MRKIAFLLLLLSGCISVGCKKKLTQFYIDYTAQATVPATVTTFLPFSVNTPALETNSTYEFESNNTRKDHIRSIYLKNLELNIVSPNGETFSFVNTIELFISSPGLSEKRVAYLDSIPNNVGNALSLSLENTDLQEYIKSETYELRLKVISDETIPQDVQIDIHTSFLVDAQLIRKKK